MNLSDKNICNLHISKKEENMLIPENIPVFPMSQLHHLITAITNRIMKISGCNINRIQFIILREIYSKSDLNQTSLARLIGMDRNNLSKICTELEKHNLIFRKIRTNDKRHYTLELTDYGREVYLRGNQAMENYRILTHEQYSTEEWQNFKDMLQEFFTSLIAIMEISDEELVPDASLRQPLQTEQKTQEQKTSSSRLSTKTENTAQGVKHD